MMSACLLSELTEEVPFAVTVDETPVLLVLASCDGEPRVFAMLDECSHGAVRLSEGDVSGCAVECWLHGSRFDLRTGRPSGPPATSPVPTYPTTIEGDEVFVDIENPITPEER